METGRAGIRRSFVLAGFRCGAHASPRKEFIVAFYDQLITGAISAIPINIWVMVQRCCALVFSEYCRCEASRLLVCLSLRSSAAHLWEEAVSVCCVMQQGLTQHNTVTGADRTTGFQVKTTVQMWLNLRAKNSTVCWFCLTVTPGTVCAVF